MNTDFSNIQIDYSAFKEYFYTHRVRGSFYFSCSLSQNNFVNKLLNIIGSKFVIKTSTKVYRDFKDYRYSPLEVKILLPKNGSGPLQPKHWAYVDYIKGVIHVDGEYPKQRIEEFISVLGANGIDLRINKSDYTYVEVCCRHPYHTFDKVSEAIDRLGHRFSVAKTTADTKRQPLSKEAYLHIVKDIYFDGYCNLKTYKYVKGFGSSNPSISKEIEPKLEIQINNPKSLEEAEVRGVAILKAITTSLGIPTIKLSRDFEKSEYTEILNSSKISPNEKIISVLSEKEITKLPSFPEAFRKDKNSYNIIASTYFVPKRVDQLEVELNMSESTVRRTLKKLGKLIEKRGDRKNGYLLTIDRTQLINNYELSRSNTHKGNKKNNKGKALGITLLLIIGANILFFNHFSPFSFKTFKGPENLFSLRNTPYSSLLGSRHTSVDTALMKTTEFPNQLVISTGKEVIPNENQ